MGKPNLSVSINRMEYLIPVLFGLVFLGFGLRMTGILEYGFHFAIYQIAILIPLIFPCIFIGIGLYAYILNIKENINTSYYITNKNLIILVKNRKLSIRKRRINTIVSGNMDLVEKKNASGNIIFEEALYSTNGVGTYKRVERSKEGFVFLGIDKVLDVYNIIRSLG